MCAKVMLYSLYLVADDFPFQFVASVKSNETSGIK